MEFAFLKVGVVFKKRSILRSFLPLAMLILRALFPTSLLVSKTSKAVQVLYVALLYAICYMLYATCYISNQCRLVVRQLESSIHSEGEC